MKYNLGGVNLNTLKKVRMHMLHRPTQHWSALLLSLFAQQYLHFCYFFPILLLLWVVFKKYMDYGCKLASKHQAQGLYWCLEDCDVMGSICCDGGILRRRLSRVHLMTFNNQPLGGAQQLHFLRSEPECVSQL